MSSRFNLMPLVISKSRQSLRPTSNKCKRLTFSRIWYKLSSQAIRLQTKSNLRTRCGPLIWTVVKHITNKRATLTMACHQLIQKSYSYMSRIRLKVKIQRLIWPHLPHKWPLKSKNNWLKLSSKLLHKLDQTVAWLLNRLSLKFFKEQHKVPQTNRNLMLPRQ